MELCSRIYVHTVDFNDNIIFNGLTGSIDLANQKVAKFLRSKDMSKMKLLQQDEIDALLNSGYLLEDNNETTEKHVFNKYKESLGDVINRNNFVICPTLKCNLRCSYCFERDFSDRDSTLNEDMLNKIFEFILERIVENPKPSSIELFGGEPLLEENIKIIKEIFKFASKNNIDILITTNGTQINRFKLLFEKYTNLIKKIQITIDGNKNIHDKRRIFKDGSGSFDLIIENVKYILDLGIPVDVRVNIDKSNINSIDQIVEEVFNLSELMLYDNFSYYFSNVTDHYNLNNKLLIDESDLAIELDKSHLVDKGSYPTLGYLIDSIINKPNGSLPNFVNCEANSKYNHIIAPDGYVYNCPEAIGLSNFRTWQYYPVQNSFKSVNKSFYNNILTDSNRPTCRKCSIALLCGGGCILIENNKSNKKQFCIMQHKMVNKYFTYLRKKLALN